MPFAAVDFEAEGLEARGLGRAGVVPDLLAGSPGDEGWVWRERKGLRSISRVVPSQSVFSKMLRM